MVQQSVHISGTILAVEKAKGQVEHSCFTYQSFVTSPLLLDIKWCICDFAEITALELRAGLRRTIGLSNDFSEQ